jgi:hypothetical protein
MKGDDELGVALGGNPLTAYVRVTGEVQTYLVADVVAGTAAEPLDVMPVGFGGRGEAFVHDQGPLVTSTREAMEILEVDGPRIVGHREIAWDADGREGGRNGRMRLTSDATRIYGAVAAPVAAEEWVSRVNDGHSANLADGSSRRVELANGIISRFAISAPYALFVQVHPDSDHRSCSTSTRRPRPQIRSWRASRSIRSPTARSRAPRPPASRRGLAPSPPTDAGRSSRTEVTVLSR